MCTLSRKMSMERHKNSDHQYVAFTISLLFTISHRLSSTSRLADKIADPSPSHPWWLILKAEKRCVLMNQKEREHERKNPELLRPPSCPLTHCTGHATRTHTYALQRVRNRQWNT
jgi:hypothetical protein